MPLGWPVPHRVPQSQAYICHWGSWSSTSGLRWDFKQWKRDTVHKTVLFASLLQATGMVGMWQDLPKLGPALVVQDHVKGCVEK